MQTDLQTDKATYNEDEYLDLGEIAFDYLRCLKKYWIWFLILIASLAVIAVVYTSRRYEPSFQAKVSYIANRIGEANVDIYTAKSLSGAVATIAAIPDFKEELLEEAGLKKGGQNYRISSAYTTGSNIFTVSVYSNDYEKANLVLEAFEKVYPEWASKSNGTVELQVMDRVLASNNPMNSFSVVKSMAKGAVLGGGICFLFATWYVLTIKTIRKESDMKRITAKNCISSIPDVKVKRRSKNAKKKEHLLITNKRIDWGFQQSILSAQSRIERQMLQKDQKVLLVSSTVPNEGKSLITLNLALAFAKSGKKVLVFDGDLRKPSIRRILGCKASKLGIIDYFKGEARFNEIIVRVSNIFVMDSGPECSEVSGVISEEKMMQVMVFLRSKFDYILIDTPPSHLFTDAALLEKCADCVVYVVRNDMASFSEVKDGIDPFIRSDKLLGYIINRSKGIFSVYGKYGYTKYGHYGKYKKYLRLDKEPMNTEDTL